jgi:hypothetical protein
LKWADVDFGRSRIIVHSPKTEHHEGHEKREVPVFAELRPFLEAAKAQADQDAEYVIAIPTVERFRSGAGKKPNLGTRMGKIIRRAGLEPWPKLFHNLRASRQTELVQRFPEHVVCEWIGNSQAVAREHYLRVTDADYAKATYLASLGEAPEDARGAKNGKRQGKQPELAENSLLLQIVQKALESEGLEQFAATVGKALQNYQAPPVGLESTRAAFHLCCI